ncbi:hypothetical protein [uncultured Pseudoalteromonas sp.]|uniref:hypothetical protein n=1 Tax=uncultured Pseudoalteromonas sp. TaxID=114053 RepID=UPI0030C7E600
MDLTKEELSFISSVVGSSKDDKHDNSQLTLRTTLPDTLKGLLSHAKLTMLAEIGHYQLWFPLEFKLNDDGYLSPVLSAPEVIDTEGVDRSWRYSDLYLQSERFYVLSLSSSGVLLKPRDHRYSLTHEQHITFKLPNRKKVTLLVDLVRKTNLGYAAKIVSFKSGKEALREYLFEKHKRENANLYENSTGVAADF